MNVEYWIAKLTEDDPLTAMLRLQRFRSSQLQGAIPALLKLVERDDWVLACQAAQLVIRIAPLHTEQLAKLFKFLLAAQPCGWMLPDVVESFEKLAVLQPDAIEQLGEALTYPHFRVRVAAARGLAAMGEFLELIEPQLTTAIEDQSGCVTEAILQTLQNNRSSLSADLRNVLSGHQLNFPDQEQTRERDSLERLLWRPRASRLNGLGEDGEDAIFFLRFQSPWEKGLTENDLLNHLLVSHNLPPAVSSLCRIDRQDTTSILLNMMCPVFSNKPVCEDPVELLANRLCNYFDENVRIYSNVIVQNGLLAEYQPVAFGMIDNGLLLVDEEQVGIFWINDID